MIVAADAEGIASMKDVVFQFRRTDNSDQLSSRDKQIYLAKFFDENLEELGTRKHEFLQKHGMKKLHYKLPSLPDKRMNQPSISSVRMTTEQKEMLNEVAGVLGINKKEAFEIIMYHAVKRQGDMKLNFNIFIDASSSHEMFQTSLLNRFGRIEG